MRLFCPPVPIADIAKQPRETETPASGGLSPKSDQSVVSGLHLKRLARTKAQRSVALHLADFASLADYKAMPRNLRIMKHGRAARRVR